jgi:hypothetical protein
MSHFATNHPTVLGAENGWKKTVFSNELLIDPDQIFWDSGSKSAWTKRCGWPIHAAPDIDPKCKFRYYFFRYVSQSAIPHPTPLGAENGRKGSMAWKSGKYFEKKKRFSSTTIVSKDYKEMHWGIYVHVFRKR